ncbi:hypothetical protein [Ideonella sp. YS5]|uniref:hypothetical protein n=1 Tax=Ideonella sp. YS5 TaxID=3453714 RepID=UPI003EEF0174
MAKKRPSRSTLGVQMRGALAEQYGQRGKGKSHLWYFYSDKGRTDFVVPSDVQFGHVLLLESEPRIQSVSFRPPLRLAPTTENLAGTIFDAEATCSDGSIELHEAKPSSSLGQSPDAHAARQLAIQREIEAFERSRGKEVRHVLLTENEIFANPVRIRNWFVALPWLAQARNHSLLQPGNEVAALIHAEERVSLGQLLDSGGPLYVAAVLRFVAHGRFASDLDTVPFTRRTVFLDRRRQR